MTDIWTSVVRTIVPKAVTLVIGWLAIVGIGGVDSASLALFLESVLFAVYYTVVRFAALKWPWLEAILGAKATPTYRT